MVGDLSSGWLGSLHQLPSLPASGTYCVFLVSLSLSLFLGNIILIKEFFCSLDLLLQAPMAPIVYDSLPQ